MEFITKKQTAVIRNWTTPWFKGAEYAECQASFVLEWFHRIRFKRSPDLGNVQDKPVRNKRDGSKEHNNNKKSRCHKPKPAKYPEMEIQTGTGTQITHHLHRCERNYGDFSVFHLGRHHYITTSHHSQLCTKLICCSTGCHLLRVDDDQDAWRSIPPNIAVSGFVCKWRDVES